MEMMMKTQHLPQDLITEILWRSPVKSLVRFKVVCKFWRSLISDPHFAQSHFELATPRPVFNTLGGIRTMDFDGSLHTNPISEEIKFDSTRSPFSILGSCRGFLLLKLLDDKESLYMWNPSARVHKAIPSDTICTDYLCGFGYDSSKDDYLVVRVFLSYLPKVYFFSLRANMWKYTKDDLLRGKVVRHRLGLFFNKAIHWLAYVRKKFIYVIVAFDLMQKRLFEIPLPDHLALHLKSCDLWVHGRFLSLSMVRWDNTTDIWVMKKYRVRSSWTKTHVLSMSGFPSLSPICSTKSGDIVMANATELVKYSNKGELLEHLELQMPIMSTESMFSLPGVAEQKLKKMTGNNN